MKKIFIIYILTALTALTCISQGMASNSKMLDLPLLTSIVVKSDNDIKIVVRKSEEFTVKADYFSLDPDDEQVKARKNFKDCNLQIEFKSDLSAGRVYSREMNIICNLPGGKIYKSRISGYLTDKDDFKGVIANTSFVNEDLVFTIPKDKKMKIVLFKKGKVPSSNVFNT